MMAKKIAVSAKEMEARALHALTKQTWTPIDLGPPYVLGEKGLDVVGQPTLLQAARALKFLQEFNERSQFYLGDLFNDSESRFGEEVSQLLDHTTYSLESLRNFGWVSKSIPPARRFLGDGVSFSKHQAVAALTDKEQDRILKKSVSEGMTLSDVRRAARLVKRKRISTGQAELKGTHRVIYADPPWSYDDSGKMPGKSFTRAEDHYATMPTADIAAMAIEAHAQTNAVLFLWVPVPLLPEAFTVIDAWGFTYKNKIVWSKLTHVHGHYLSNRHEDLLLATRGSCAPDRLTPMIENVQVIKQTGENSAKPEQFRALIERLYDGPFLELFARQDVDGWTCWGDQVGVMTQGEAVE